MAGPDQACIPVQDAAALYYDLLEACRVPSNPFSNEQMSRRPEVKATHIKLSAWKALSAKLPLVNVCRRMGELPHRS